VNRGRIRRARVSGQHAIHRAALTVFIDTIEQVDDSLGMLGELFREHESLYLRLLERQIEALGTVRDLLELVVWEDYGFFNQVDDFLRGLPEPHADLAARELARIIAELRAADLDYQLDIALRIRRVLLQAADRLPGETVDTGP
jgi:hypothetical protein